MAGHFKTRSGGQDRASIRVLGAPKVRRTPHSRGNADIGHIAQRRRSFWRALARVDGLRGHDAGALTMAVAVARRLLDPSATPRSTSRSRFVRMDRMASDRTIILHLLR